jgi:hypothetical protein
MRYAGFAVLLLGASALGRSISVTPSASTVAQGSNATFTVCVDPTASLQQVVLTYAGEIMQDSRGSAPFEFTHQFNTPMDALTVTATAKYSNGDPDLIGTTDINVVGLAITGAASVSRGWSTTYTAQSAPSGKAVSSFNWTFQCAGGSNSYQDSDSDGDHKSSWGGVMACPGTFSCSGMVEGVYVQTEKTVSISPRNWTVPITCAQDNEPDWGGIPSPSATLGENRDRDSNYDSYVFVPRNGSDFAPARVLATVYAGPCAGVWYVYSSTLRCQRETVISKYIKSNGPALGGRTFVQANTYCFSSSPGDFLQAIKNHEYRGTPDTFKSVEGHQGRAEKTIRDYDCDAKQHIEALFAWDPVVLSASINDAISYDEYCAYDFIRDEYYLTTYGPNWGIGPESLGIGMCSLWSDTYWTDCVCGHSGF